MKKRIAFAVAAAVFLAAAVFSLRSVLRAPTFAPEKTDLPVIAYVPLDDRPVNTDRVAYLAASLAYALHMPDEALYRTRLDAQPRNPNGSGHGDREALLQWVAQQDADGCDLFVLSLDQLLSGGLVHSRAMWESRDLHFSDGTILSEYEAIDAFLLPLANDPNNRIFLLDTVMRLAPTVGYDGWDLDGYEALRSYGMSARQPLAGEALTVEGILAGYGFSADGTTPIAPAEGRTLPDAQTLQNYHAARARKLRLCDYLLEKTAEQPQFQFLIGVDDSAPEASIQTNELAYLRSKLAARGTLLSGADGLGMLSLTKLYAQTCGLSPKVCVRYFGGSENGASSDYDHQPMTEIVENHLSYLGAQRVEDAAAADLELLVLTAPAGDKKAPVEDLIAALNGNEEAGKPSILMDAAKNQYGFAFQERLLAQTHPGYLLGYGGFYDLANVTGVALSNGYARYLALQCDPVRSAAQEQAFLRTLTDSLIKDLCYKSRAKVSTIRYVKDTLGGDPDNFCRTNTDSAAVLERTIEFLGADSKKLLKNLSSGNFIVSLAPFRECGIGKISLSDYSFPWQRVFELRYRISFAAFDAPRAVSPAADAHLAAVLPLGGAPLCAR